MVEVNSMTPKVEGHTKMKKHVWKKKIVPYIFIAPSVILFSIFMLYPIGYSFVMSFQTSAGGEMTFNGLENYKRLFNDDIF
ncbi:L-arabinose transport system permease protein AraP [Anoxybacillus sp. BCO1]|nr:L-arabinose transport system permease protein AraP [Anoxybacillus sp. BCO1]